ncbi:olfactory receptor 2AP1-like [Lacerta agilis]|uniref:olfactory receptor 2AP1-like n=1 Tax=Lacerta agilis TaxID=80427 RepID=UPI001419A495|nr:olfactory receptor 2AP1-like [Lacerta agilis]
MQRNLSEITEFILLGFGDLPHLHIFLFLVFLVIYILTIVFNIVMVFLIVTDHHLHTPMYFFLGNLSFLEAAYSSTTLPRMLTSLLTGDKTISVKGCHIQFFVVSFLVGTECYLLSVMSYDRFLAICKPLYYATLMNCRLCIQLASCSWMNSIVLVSICLVLMWQLRYCGSNEIDHFFCESLSLVKISCSDTSLVKYFILILAFVFSFPPFIWTLISYIYIIAAILKIPSTTGKQKAFSTCSSHVIVVSLFYGALIIVYVTPKTEAMRELSKVFSLLYTVLPPLINPLVYSLRNKDVKESFSKATGKILKAIL